MAFLFHEVVFGPVRSRRLGLSLGINLLPRHRKFCSFNCIYCECGWTLPAKKEFQEMPSREEVAGFLEQRLKELVAEDYLPDALTYAGNGEPTLHPEFSQIVDDTLHLRDLYAPQARVTVLSNASMIDVPPVFKALLKLDDNILKLDAGTPGMFEMINKPVQPVDFHKLVEKLEKFNGHLTIQSMFLRGIHNGVVVDNTGKEEVAEWISHLVKIRPRMVMIYPIARATPVHDLHKIPGTELNAIAEKVREAGLKVQVYE